MADKTHLPKATQIAGPGVPGLEHEAPVYHFDVRPDDFDEFIRDPARYLERLGLTRDEAPRGQISRVGVLDSEVWEPGKGWMDNPPDPQFWRTGCCCTWKGGRWVCEANRG
jgi:hypothetical protein